MGTDPRELRRGIQENAELVAQELTRMATPANSNQRLRQIAEVSLNGNVAVASLIASIYEKAGLDAVISIEDGKQV